MSPPPDMSPADPDEVIVPEVAKGPNNKKASPGGGVLERIKDDIDALSAEVGADGQGNAFPYTLGQLKEMRDRSGGVAQSANSPHTKSAYRSINNACSDLIGLLEDAKLAAAEGYRHASEEEVESEPSGS